MSKVAAFCDFIDLDEADSIIVLLWRALDCGYRYITG
jgi:hypothetical protein